ncbi:MAG TPA: tetratricopeptide repeat protein [Steroidobacteraceae bacterium]|nr:tetratricopeptide repeat protein [Steroidobacteraceae bacterium]
MRKPPISLDAWGAYQRGLWHLGKFGAEDHALAQGFFQRAIDLDPNFAGGYAGLAVAKRRAVQRLGLLERDDVAELARRAVLLDPNDAEARARLGFILLGRGDHDGALAEVESALAISPNLAGAHASLRSDLAVLRPPEGRARRN